MKQNSKNWLFKAILVAMVLANIANGAKAVATEQVGEILFITREFALIYHLDTDGDALPDRRMSLSSATHGTRIITVLSKYFEPGVKIVFEDRNLKPREDFGAGRLLGFYMPDGRFVRLDQLFSDAEIKTHLPYLREKLGGVKVRE
jgi:hypothetical protein